jgi:hypothetical protein
LYTLARKALLTHDRFVKGHAILIGTISIATCLTSFMTIYLRRENARRDVIAGEQGVTMDDLSDAQEREKGDDAVFFRYTV